jgi:hypothetical protein
MVLSNGKDFRTLEETGRHMLSAPAWSPDGKSLAYLRIPLFTQDEIEKMKEATKKRGDLWGELDKPAMEPKDPLAAVALGEDKTKEPAPQKASSPEDLTLPPMEKMLNFIKGATGKPRVPAFLIVRNAASGEVTSVTQTELVGGADSFFELYLTSRPQYSPDGKYIYVCAKNVLMAISPDEGKERAVAAPASIAALSPDGSMAAVLQENALGLVRTDGSTALYRRWDTENLSLSGLAWMNKETVGILRIEQTEPGTEAQPAQGKQEHVAVIEQVRADGSPAKPLRIPLPPFELDKGLTGELAVAPNAKGLVLSFGHDVFFLKPDGTVLLHWHPDDKGPMLVEPTFTPDSMHVAFKKMAKTGETDRAAAIVFYAPEGKEESSAEIPPAKAK